MQGKGGQCQGWGTGDKGQGAMCKMQGTRAREGKRGAGGGMGGAGSLEGREGGCGKGWSDRAQIWAREKILNNMGGNPCA